MLEWELGPLFYFIHLCSSFLGRRGREGETPSILRLGISQPDGQSKNNLLSPCPPPWRPKMSSFSNLVSDELHGAVLGVCSASTSTRQLSSSDKKKWTTDGRARRRRIGGGAISPVDKSLLSLSLVRPFGFIFRLFGVALNLWSVTEERRGDHPSNEGDGQKAEGRHRSFTRLLVWLLNSTLTKTILRHLLNECEV